MHWEIPETPVGGQIGAIPPIFVEPVECIEDVSVSEMGKR